jgi:hypothetical protein
LPSLSHQGTPSPDDSNEAVISTSLAETQKGPSKYQLQREANIEENRQLLATLGLLGGGSALLDKSLPKGKRKKREKGKRYAFCIIHTAYRTMVQHFFRSPNDGATSTTSATDQAHPVTGSPPASTTSNGTSPSTIQPLAAAVACPRDDNPALTSASNG